MNTSEASTTTRLLFRSFWLIFAATQPRAQESISTAREISRVSTSPPRTADAVTPTVTQ